MTRRNRIKNQINIRQGDIIQLKYEKEGQFMSTSILDNSIQVQRQEDSKPCPNRYDFNFKLLTRVNFESAQALKYQQDSLRTESNTKNSDEQARKKLELLRKRSEKESQMNESMISYKNGKDLLQGETVILQHHHSSKYLRVDDTTIIKDIRTCRIYLADEVDEKCLFKLIAGQEFRVDGHQVQKGDLIILYNEKTDRQVHVSAGEEEMIIKREPCLRRPMRALAHPEPFIKRANTEFAELIPCNAMIDEQRNIRFTVILQRPQDEMENVVQAGDLVKLYHTDHKGYLCAEVVTDPSLRDKIADPQDLPLFVLKTESDNTDDLEKEHCGSIFEVEYWNDYRTDTSIVDRDPQGRPCLYESIDGHKPTYALKHLITGSFVTSKQAEAKKFPCLSGFMDNSSSEDEVRKVTHTSPLTIVSKNQSKGPQIYQNDNVQIENRYEDENPELKHWKDFVYLTDNKDKNSGLAKNYQTEGTVQGFDEDNKFQVPAHSGTSIRVPMCQDKVSNNKDTFSIKRVPIELVNKVKQVQQANQVFRLQISRLRNEVTRDLVQKDKELVKRLEDRLDKMIQFVFDVSELDLQPGETAESLEKIPVRFHQKIFNDMNLMESLVDILQFSVIYFDEFEPPIQQAVFKSLNKIYRLTRFIVQNQNRNQLYVAQWMNYFFSHVNPNVIKIREQIQVAKTLNRSTFSSKLAMTLASKFQETKTSIIPPGQVLKPETVLTIVYSNNLEILAKVEESKIQLIVNYLIQNEMHERYLNILASMCNCQGQPMLMKQKSIVGLLTKNQNQIENQIGIDIQIENEILQVACNKLGTRMEFNNDFIFIKQTTELSQQQRQLLAQIDLLSALCDGSFKEGIQLAKLKWSVDKIVTILRLDAHYLFKVKLTNLCQKIYLDGQTENILIEYTHTTQMLPDIEQGHADLFIRQNDRSDPEVYKLKDVVRHTLTMKRETVQSTGTLEYHYVCNAILKLFQALMDYGQVISNKEISNFSAILIHNLDSRFDYPEPNKEMQSPTQDNMVIFENKKMMCDMLNHVISIRVNVVNQQFLNILSKDLQNEELCRLQDPLVEIFEGEPWTIRAYLESGVKKFANEEEEDEQPREASNRDVEYIVRNKPYWDLINCIQDLPVKVNIFNKNYLFILADLLKFQDNELLNKVLQNLFREFKFKREMLASLEENHVIQNDGFSEHIFQWTLRLKSTQSAAIKNIKSYITNPDSAQSILCYKSLKHCAKFLRFLVLHTLKNDENVISHASTIPSPIDVEVYYDEILDPQQKKSLAYKDFLISQCHDEVQVRWFEIQRNCQVQKAVLEFLFHPSIFNDVLSSGIIYNVHDDASKAFNDENQHVRHISFIKPHLLMFLIQFAQCNEKNRRRLLPWVKQFVSHGRYRTPDPRCVDTQFLFNRLTLEIISDHPTYFKEYSKPLIQNLSKFIKTHWDEGNWEVILGLDCLRALIQFQGEYQKENQILILVEMEINFFKECLTKFEELIVTWTSQDDISLDRQQPDGVGKTKVLRPDHHIDENPNLEGFWKKGQQSIQVPQLLKFQERVMMLMNDLIAGKNEATVSQIRKAFTLDLARQLYPKLGFQYIAKQIFNSLLLNLYFDSDKDDSQIQSQIQNFLTNQIQEIDSAVEITSIPPNVEHCSKQRVLKLEGLIRTQGQKEQLNFITNCIVPFAYLLATKMSSDLRPLAEKLKTLYKAMAMDFSTFNSFSKSQEFVLQRVSVNDERDEFKQLANEVFDITFNTEWGNQKLRSTSDSDQRKTFCIRPLVTIDEPNPFEQTIHTRLSLLTHNELLQREFNQDMNELVRQLTELPDRDEIFIKVINILIEGNSVLSEDIVISLLRLLRRIIENANKTKTDKDIYDWEVSDCEQDKPINDAQQMLADMGACEIIFKVFIDYNDLSVRDECMKLAIAMLYSGNENIQTWFYDKFESPQKTEFLLILVDLISHNFDMVSRFEISKINSFLEKALLIDDEEVDSDAGQQEVQEDTQTEQDFHTQTGMYVVIRTLRFIQLLCENHNHQLQDKLREQETGKSVNVIEIITRTFGRYLKIFNKRNLRLGVQLLTTMIESIQGPNKANQNKLVEDKVVDNIRDIMFLMRKEENLEKKLVKSDDTNLIQFNTKIMILLTSLLEGNCDQELTLKIYRSCEFPILIERLRKIFTQFCKDCLKTDIDELGYDQVFKVIRQEYNTSHQTNSLILREGFNITILMLQIIHLADEARVFVQNISDSRDKLAFDFFNKNIGNVEIDIDDDLFTIFFPILPVCRHLSPLTIENFNETVDRENQVSKITGLLETYPYFLKEMQLNEDLQIKSKDSINFLNTQYVKLLADVSFTIAWIQNIMILFFIKRPRCDVEESGYDYGSCPGRGECFRNICNFFQWGVNRDQQIENWYLQVSTVFGTLQTFTSLTLLSIWFKTSSRLTTQIYWHKIIMNNREDFRRENKAKGMDDNEIKQNLDQNEEYDELLASAERELEILQLKGPWCHEFMLNTPPIDGNPSFSHLLSYLSQQQTSLESIITNVDFCQYILQITFSLLGNFVHEFFYSQHLLDIIKRYPALQNVVKSVTQNFTELSLTILFLLIINYTFSGIAFQSFSELYQVDGYEQDQPVVIVNADGTQYTELQTKLDSPCDFMTQCFFQTLQFGLKNGGGVGDEIELPSDISEKHQTAFVFVMSQFFWVSILLLNVIFGTIINTFAELRNNRFIQEQDMKNLCQICSLSRDEIDRLGTPFDQHVEHIHNKLCYAQQLVHMDYKSLTEQDGIESKVYDLRISGDFGWIPLQTTKKLRDLNSAEADTDQVKEIQEDIEEVDGTLDLVFEKLNRLK